MQGGTILVYRLYNWVGQVFTAKSAKPALGNAEVNAKGKTDPLK